MRTEEAREWTACLGRTWKSYVHSALRRPPTLHCGGSVISIIAAAIRKSLFQASKMSDGNSCEVRTHVLRHDTMAVRFNGTPLRAVKICSLFKSVGSVLTFWKRNTKVAHDACGASFEQFRAQLPPIKDVFNTSPNSCACLRSELAGHIYCIGTQAHSRGESSIATARHTAWK